MFGPVVPSSGPLNASILILAEAPGEAESDKLKPLLGPSGYALRQMLATIGVSLDDCYKTNVFSRRPPAQNLAAFATLTPSSRARSLGPLTRTPTAWIGDEWLPELTRLREEIRLVNPNVILALGNTATWALGLGDGISELRGYVFETATVGDLDLPRRFKVLPTFHPAAILRRWDQRTICISDLEKARVESTSPAFSPDNSELWLSPTAKDLAEFSRLHLQGATLVATDVETKRGQITCVSFAPTPHISICVPFWQEGPNPHYWPDEAAEVAAWRWCAGILEDSKVVKVLQNGLYDAQYFIKHGIHPRNCSEDTMLLHHSLYSELQKGLGFLGSVYCNISSWKSMRTYKREELLKKDD